MYCLPGLSGEGEASEGRKAVGHGRGVDVDGHGEAPSEAEVQVAIMMVLSNRAPGVPQTVTVVATTGPPLLSCWSLTTIRATQVIIE